MVQVERYKNCEGQIRKAVQVKPKKLYKSSEKGYINHKSQRGH